MHSGLKSLSWLITAATVKLFAVIIVVWLGNNPTSNKLLSLIEDGIDLSETNSDGLTVSFYILEKLISDAGCRLKYLPTYSPDFNPIEHYWHKVKTIIRKLRKLCFSG